MVLCIELLDEALPNIGNIWFPKVFIDSNLKNQTDLWESLIKLTNIRPQIWIIGSTKKPMLPKYLKYLSTGCHGLGNVVYPCQLVLFTNIPRELMTQGVDTFTIDFLESCWKGFFTKSIHNDTKEFSKMVLEVAWYCISQIHSENAASAGNLMKIGFLDPIYSTLKKEVIKFTFILE